jgi:two-component system, NtrC family, response regulator HydG
MPPLRDRPEDIPILVDHFLKQFSEKMNKKIAGVSLDVERRFTEYLWPGNVRELEHALEHACVLCDSDVITIDHLPSHLKLKNIDNEQFLRGKSAVGSLAIIQALEKTAWNKKRVARLLGIDRKTLYRNILKYNIAPATLSPASPGSV